MRGEICTLWTIITQRSVELEGVLISPSCMCCDIKCHEKIQLNATSTARFIMITLMLTDKSITVTKPLHKLFVSYTLKIIIN